MVNPKNQDMIPVAYSQKNTAPKTLATSNKNTKSLGLLGNSIERTSKATEPLPMYPGGSFPTLGLSRYDNSKLDLHQKNPYGHLKQNEQMLVANERQRINVRFEQNNRYERPVHKKSLPNRPDRAGHLKAVSRIDPLSPEEAVAQIEAEK